MKLKYIILHFINITNGRTNDNCQNREEQQEKRGPCKWHKIHFSQCWQILFKIDKWRNGYIYFGISRGLATETVKQ